MKAKTTERKLNYEQGKYSKTYRRVCDAGYRNNRLRATQAGRSQSATRPQAAPQVQYTVIDLGTDGVGNQITDSGRIVGSINFGGPDRDAAFWPTPQSPPIDLGTLPGFTGSRGFGINPRGEIVG